MHILNWLKQRNWSSILYKANIGVAGAISVFTICLMIYICIVANNIWSAIIWCVVILFIEMIITLAIHALFAAIASVLEWDDYYDE